MSRIHVYSPPLTKLTWLRAHEDLWKSAKLVPLPGGTYRYFVEPSVHKIIVNAMKSAGLLAPSTYYLDVKIGKYVRILRGLR